MKKHVGYYLEAPLIVILLPLLLLGAVVFTLASPSPKTQEALLRAAVEVAVQRIDEGHCNEAHEVLIDVLEDTR